MTSASLWRVAAYLEVVASLSRVAPPGALLFNYGQVVKVVTSSLKNLLYDTPFCLAIAISIIN